jgi:hypothetical protein
MAEAGVIADYLTVLSAQLPASVVEELADGLDQTCERYLNQGLGAQAAAEAAIAEFGAPEVILAHFTRLSPARQAARRLLATGPAVGGCWAIALITGRAWSWPVPVAARVLVGVALGGTIGLLATAAFSTKYRSIRRAGTAGCAGITALDITMLVTAALVLPAVAWPVILAMAASAARLTFTAMVLRPVMKG